jgi:TPR repeat protein
MHDNGYGVPQDYGQAKQWYEKAAAQGLTGPQYSLGRLFYYGYGVPQDYGKARHWWEKAAAQGHASSQYNLGVLYDKGHGVPQDFVQAHMWFNLSDANGERGGAVQRDALAKQMTPAQITEAQKMAQKWKPKAP